MLIRGRLCVEAGCQGNPYTFCSLFAVNLKLLEKRSLKQKHQVLNTMETLLVNALTLFKA